jgi:hypothetical protein
MTVAICARRMGRAITDTMKFSKSSIAYPLVLAIAVWSVSSNGQTPQPTPTRTAATEPAGKTPAGGDSTVTNETATGTETVVFLRHAEKPKRGLGQLTPQGLNRALALVNVLPKKFGKPDFIFAPDPIQKVDGEPGYYYVRPLATIEPLAISLEMPVQTPFGYKQIDKLNAELIEPRYATSTIFVAWEHGYEDVAVKNLVKQLGGNSAEVPGWPGPDFDSLFVLRIVRVPGKPMTISFTHDHENLDHQSTAMPVAAVEPAR